MSWAEPLHGCRPGWPLAARTVLGASPGTAHSSAAALPPASHKSHCGSKDSRTRGGTARWPAHTCVSRKAAALSRAHGRRSRESVEQPTKIHHSKCEWALRKSKASFSTTRKYPSDPRSTDWERWSWCPNCNAFAFSSQPVSTLAGHCISGPHHLQIFMFCTDLRKPLRVFPVLSCSFPFPFSFFPPLPSRGKNTTDVLKTGEKTTEQQQMLPVLS